MVLFYSSNALGDDQPVVIYAGKDKFERMDWEKVPEKLLLDAGHICKAGSIQGNKQAVTIIYCKATNILKRGDFATGAVTFHDPRKVKRFRIEERVNAIVNRLNKTKVERQVDHEAERIERERQQHKLKRAAANERANADLALARQRKADAEARSYANLHAKEGTDEWEEDEWERNRKEGDFDPDDDFM
ncbi:hypothetical protein Rhopal_005860-T1 [Rhodotorula paludigena]|uniref:NFACT RNA-binding domain-containing protein n=1 Tax=Rhodotorula paludigena TaxID=86838 RepID=A0AAV5GTJ0_9BASI|nr:hypothetical protein Rhopal_005860-T1 [Rhodotorula paludigena]